MYWPGDFDINLIPAAGRIDQHHGQDSKPASQGQLFTGSTFSNMFAGFLKTFKIIHVSQNTI